MNTFIIAEAGANHNRDFDIAKKLIDVATESGADAVKFQTYSSGTLYSKNTPDFAGYKNINKLIKDIELPREWQKDLKNYCDDVGIEFMSTPFDEQAVDELYELGIKRFKIAGFEATDPRFVKYVRSTKLPLIISLGIGADPGYAYEIHKSILREHGSDLDKVEAAQDDFGNPDDFKESLHKWYKENMPDITYLHCNNAYPTPFEDINLGSFLQLKNLIQWNNVFCNSSVGLSDHTEGILIPPIAVAMGAQVIEKHFTLDRRMKGPDHAFAIEPGELKDMVHNIRISEKITNTKNESFTKSEARFRAGCRSVVTTRALLEGHVIQESDITTKRPFLENSISAAEYYKIIGKTLDKDLEEDIILEYSYLK